MCNVRIPQDRKIDGINLVPFITGKNSSSVERPLFFYWSRHNPELYNNIALLKGRYKIVGQTDFNSPIDEFQLFDIEKDPYEQNNIVREKPLIASVLKTELDSLLHELAGSDNLSNPPCIQVGSIHENPVILNRNDADGERGIWDQEEVYGKWNLYVNEGYYNIRFRFIKPLPANGRMMVETKSFINQMKNFQENVNLLEMKNVYLPSMKCDFIPFYEAGSRRIFPFWVEIEKIGK
jgi:arylsulfatase